jgi:hypothetical protein
MSVPQMKDRPASMLRAMFAGLGSLLSVVDKVRSKPAAPAPSDAETPVPQGAAVPETTTEPEVIPQPEATATPETTAEPEPEIVAVAVTAEPEIVASEVAAEPEIVVAEVTTGPEIAAAEVTAAPETVTAETTAAPTSGALPLANYDESSIGSLRARLRNLSVEQLTQLVEYEKSHAARADVISMFERRIVKVQAES